MHTNYFKRQYWHQLEAAKSATFYISHFKLQIRCKRKRSTHSHIRSHICTYTYIQTNCVYLNVWFIKCWHFCLPYSGTWCHTTQWHFIALQCTVTHSTAKHCISNPFAFTIAAFICIFPPAWILLISVHYTREGILCTTTTNTHTHMHTGVHNICAYIFIVLHCIIKNS